MSTCGTCRHRGEAIKTNHAPDGRWMAEPVDTAFFLCDLIKHTGTESELGLEVDKTGARVVDGSGYFAALCVADDFGCNRWAAIAEGGES